MAEYLTNDSTIGTTPRPILVATPRLITRAIPRPILFLMIARIPQSIYQD